MHPIDRFPARALALSALLMAFTPWLPARAADLTLAEAERIALDRDAMTREMRAQGQAMRERSVMEGQLMDPQLRLGAVNVPVDSLSLDEEDMTMLELGVSQEFTPRGARRQSQRQMLQLASAMESSALDRERQVRRDVRKLWTQLAYIAEARALLQTHEGWVEQLRQSARARYASGEGKQLDVLQAGLEAAMLREQQLDLDRDEAMYRAQLSFWIGPDVAATARPRGLPARGEMEPLATLQARLDAHPQQVDFERRIEAAKTGIEAAREQRKPNWMLDLSYGFRQGDMQTSMDGAREPRSDMVSAMVTVGLPLFRGNRQDREVAARRFEAEGLHDQHEDHRREMQAMLAEAWHVEQRTGELEKFYEDELLKLADQSVQAALLGWGANRVMFEEVAMARRAALDTRLKHLRLSADRALAQHDIEYLAGDAS